VQNLEGDDMELSEGIDNQGSHGHRKKRVWNMQRQF
jgi:hypothetical protein